MSAGPGTQEQPPAPPQPPAAGPAPALPAHRLPDRAPELEPPWSPADEPTGGGRSVEPRRGGGHPTGESRVPHQAGDRLPMIHPASGPGPTAEGTAPSPGPAARSAGTAPVGRPTATPTGRSAAPADPPRTDRPALERAPRRAGSQPTPLAADSSGREVAAPRQRAASRPDRPIRPTRVRAPKIKFGDRDPSVELAITEIAGHLTFTPNTVTAWYWLPEVRWAFRPDAEREALLSAISEQYAGLAGFRLHLRRTTRPFPADEWARTIDAHTPAPLPDVSGTTGWADHLVAAQRHLMAVNHAEGQTYLGVTFARRSLGDSLTERLLRSFGRGTAEGERRKLGRTVEQFDEVLGAFGMRGRRVTAQELEWLLYRSVALCMAPPGALPGHRRALGAR
ncbi:hypothetical protein GCM10027614_52890 [Micromonospora vulcania]